MKRKYPLNNDPFTDPIFQAFNRSFGFLMYDLAMINFLQKGMITADQLLPIKTECHADGCHLLPYGLSERFGVQWTCVSR